MAFSSFLISKYYWMDLDLHYVVSYLKNFGPFLTLTLVSQKSSNFLGSIFLVAAGS